MTQPNQTQVRALDITQLSDDECSRCEVIAFAITALDAARAVGVSASTLRSWLDNPVRGEARTRYCLALADARILSARRRLRRQWHLADVAGVRRLEASVSAIAWVQLRYQGWSALRGERLLGLHPRPGTVGRVQ